MRCERSTWNTAIEKRHVMAECAMNASKDIVESSIEKESSQKMKQS
jgi:hypothetical protein